MGSKKSKPCIITYRDYKKFNNNDFRSEIQSLRSREADLGFFKDSIFHVFNKHVPIKKKYLCPNEATSVTKELHVVIIKRSILKNKFLRQKIRQTWIITKFNVIFAKNFCEKPKARIVAILIKKRKKRNKPLKSENTIINEGDKSNSDEKKIVKYLTPFF